MKMNLLHIRNIAKRKIFWAGFLLAQFLFFYLMSKWTKAVLFFELFFERQKNWHLSVFAELPFSVGDLFYILLILSLILSLFYVFKRKYRQKILTTTLIILNVLYFTYQIFWGMLYFQPPLIEKLGTEEPSAEDAKELTEYFLQKCIESRRKVKEDKKGVFEIKNFHKIKSEIIKNQQKLPAEITFKDSMQQISIKPSLFKIILSYTGISGYYNPFTAEAQYNSELPDTHLPTTIAHETAHQLGFAREQEASFIGYLLGKSSQDEDLKYSTDFYALKSLLRSFPPEDSAYVKDVTARFSDAMQRDRNFELDFAAKHDGFLEVIFGFTNNLFLKSNRQEGSITYSYFVDLLLRYETAQKKNRVSQRDSKNTNDEKKYSLTQRPAPH